MTSVTDAFCISEACQAWISDEREPTRKDAAMIMRLCDATSAERPMTSSERDSVPSDEDREPRVVAVTADDWSSAG
jgi:hypothetical protein